MDTITPQPQEQFPTPEPKHFLNKKFIVTFVILSVLGSGAYASIWYWQKQQMTSEVVPTFTPRPTDETANWKTYTNTQYGFEFKYPATWDYENKHETNSITIGLYDTEQPYSIEGSNIAPIYISYGVDIYGGKINNYITNSQLQSIQKPSTTIAGETAYVFKGITSPIYHNFRVIFRSGQIYSLSLNYPEPEEIFNQILSTFKFTDTVVSQTSGTLSGTVSIGPNCPVEQAGHPCTPSPEAYAAVQIIVYTSDGKTIVKTANLDSSGHYSVQLPVGQYQVDYKRSGTMYPHTPKPITVTSGQTSTLNFSIDTGIR